MIKINNKKGVSEIVSYVLLIIIAVAISVLVYNFLIKFIPTGSTPQCPDGISLIPEGISCSLHDTLSFNLVNRGLWNVSGAFIKGGTALSKIKSPLPGANPHTFASPLPPNGNASIDISISTFASRIEELEISPIVINEKGETVICTNAIVLQPVTCA